MFGLAGPPPPGWTKKLRQGRIVWSLNVILICMALFDLVVLYEHPEWQKPLFAALDRRGVRYAPFDLKRAAFDPDALPEAPLYFNQASPSAYVRGNTRAVPFALSLMRSLELGGARVLNGSRAFSLELSKSAQAALLKGLDIAHPKSLAFNDPEVALQRWSGGWPALVKPEQAAATAKPVFSLRDADDIRRAFILNEVLGKPKATRKR